MWTDEWYETIPVEVRNATVDKCLSKDNASDKKDAIIAYLKSVSTDTVRKPKDWEVPNDVSTVPTRKFVIWLHAQLDESMDGYTECETAYNILDKAFRNFWFQIMVLIINPHNSLFPVFDDNGDRIKFHDKAYDRDITTPEVIRKFTLALENVQKQINEGEPRENWKSYLDNETAEQLKREMTAYLSTSDEERISRMIPHFEDLHPLWEESMFLSGYASAQIEEKTRSIERNTPDPKVSQSTTDDDLSEVATRLTFEEQG